MIITKLKGGLGNQMFQYAFGLSLSHRLNVSLKLDNIYYESDKKRVYKLDNFNISAKIATKEEIKKLTDQNIFQKILRRNNSHIFQEPNFHFFYPKALNLSDDTYLDGFWQSEKYFKGIENAIREEFKLKEALPVEAKALIESINNINSVSIHIRRGDYTQEKYKQIFFECTSEYYQKAISLISEKISNPHFFIFSDNIEWSRKLLFPENTVYIDSSFKLQEFQELAVMSKCKHNIIANSSFSWWGAWLNQNAGNIVIAPQKYYVNEKIDTSDWALKTWVKI